MNSVVMILDKQIAIRLKREGDPVMMVSPDSASQYYPGEKRVPGTCFLSFDPNSPAKRT
jgi:hypothetical protein